MQSKIVVDIQSTFIKALLVSVDIRMINSNVHARLDMLLTSLVLDVYQHLTVQLMADQHKM